MPILSRVAFDATPEPQADPWRAHDPWAEPEQHPSIGVQVLYLSPLKALINDQFDRLDQMCERADIAVHRWHGDVGEHAKRKVRDDPSGVLLITPESLEATFVNRGSTVPQMLAGLRYIVVDEMHSFMATPRGAQLQSLLNRVEFAVRRRPPRIGLSATLGDMSRAAEFLRPDRPADVVVIESSQDARALQLQLRGYVKADPAMSRAEVRDLEASGGAATVEDTTAGDQLKIADHLFRHLRGADNLVSRTPADTLSCSPTCCSRRSDAERVPNEFWPHHGSLSKDIARDRRRAAEGSHPPGNSDLHLHARRWASTSEALRRSLRSGHHRRSQPSGSASDDPVAATNRRSSASTSPNLTPSRTPIRSTSCDAISCRRWRWCN